MSNDEIEITKLYLKIIVVSVCNVIEDVKSLMKFVFK